MTTGRNPYRQLSLNFALMLLVMSIAFVAMVVKYNHLDTAYTVCHKAVVSMAQLSETRVADAAACDARFRQLHP